MNNEPNNTHIPYIAMSVKNPHKVDGAKTITLSAECIYYHQIDKVLAVSR